MATDRKKSSCSFKEPGQQDDQDEENKLLNLVEMKVCFSGLTLTQTQKNKSCLKGLGFRVRVSPEKQTFSFQKYVDSSLIAIAVLNKIYFVSGCFKLNLYYMGDVLAVNF